MLFYERIKRHGKWVFILLAVTFGATFVLGGVGAGGIGIFDLIGKGGGSGGNGSTALADRQYPAGDGPRAGTSVI